MTTVSSKSDAVPAAIHIADSSCSIAQDLHSRCLTGQLLDGAEKAAELYDVAAKAGSIEGMYSLGWMHATGLGVAQNRNHAAALYKRAIQKAPDWQHAAPPVMALLLLPSLVALQWLTELPATTAVPRITGEHGPSSAALSETCCGSWSQCLQLILS